ncbi:hypothetical protein CSKR_113992, partial [Clonorchis sinensis]
MDTMKEIGNIKKHTHLPFTLAFTRGSTESPFYDILQMNVLHTGRLMFQLVQYSRYRKGLRCGVVYLRTPTERLQTIEQGSKTLICILFTKLNIHLLLERVFLTFSGYSLTVTQIQTNARKRLYKFRNRTHFPRDAKRIYEKTYYSHASSV